MNKELLVKESIVKVLVGLIIIFFALSILEFLIGLYFLNLVSLIPDIITPHVLLVPSVILLGIFSFIGIPVSLITMKENVRFSKHLFFMSAIALIVVFCFWLFILLTSLSARW